VVDTAELRRGLAETGQYLLSHHEPADHYRCHAVTVRGRRIHVCARCSGVYPGILAGVLAAGSVPAATLVLVALLPLPALADWAVTAFTARRGHNAVRTATGLLLGAGYGLGLHRVVFAHDLAVVAVGFGYALAAAVLLVAGDRPTEPGI
jgi:uncharacterized membrane protein